MLHNAIGGMLLRPPPIYKSRQKEIRKNPPQQSQSETVLSVDELTMNTQIANFVSDVVPRLEPNKKHKDEQPMGVVNEAFIAHEATPSVEMKEDILPISLSVNKDESLENPSERKRTVSTSDALGYKTILTNLSYIRLITMTALAGFSTYPMLFITPSLALEWGASDVSASLAITVSGATELLTR